MKCLEFQKCIPGIIDKNMDVSRIDDALKHLEVCEDCQDELEISYILKYGFEDDKDDIDFNLQIKHDTAILKRRFFRFKFMKELFILINMLSATAIIGSLIYVFFKFFLRS